MCLRVFVQEVAPSSGWGGGKTFAQKLTDKDAESKKQQDDAIKAVQEAEARAAAVEMEAAAAAAVATAAAVIAAAAAVVAAAAAAKACEQRKGGEEKKVKAAEQGGASAGCEKKKRRSRCRKLKGMADGAPADSGEKLQNTIESAREGARVPAAPSPSPAIGIRGEIAARPNLARDRGVQLEVLIEGASAFETEEEERRRTRRNLRGFPAVHVPAALLRQNSTIDLADFDAAETACACLPSVVTEMLHTSASTRMCLSVSLCCVLVFLWCPCRTRTRTYGGARDLERQAIRRGGRSGSLTHYSLTH